MAKKLSTPGVYIQEKDAFPGSIVEVATSIPAFIGYTEIADSNGKSLVNKPTRITSLADYMLLFGGAFVPTFNLLDEGEWDSVAKKSIINIGGVEKAIVYNNNNELFLYRSIQLFFANGGGTCFIVSVGIYKGKKSVEVKKSDILGETEDQGLMRLLKEQEPTMIVIPDAVILQVDEFYEVCSTMLAHCAKMQSCVAILDVHDGYGVRVNANNEDVISVFREKIGIENLNYGAAYYPWLETSIIPSGEITFKNLDSTIDLASLLPSSEKVTRQVLEDYSKEVSDSISELMENKPEEYTTALAQDGLEKPSVSRTDFEFAFAKAITEKAFTDVSSDLKITVCNKEETLKNFTSLLISFIANKERNHHLALVAKSLTYTNLIKKITEFENLLPPSGAMAGLYTMVDNTRGVWKAPANVSVNSVIKPSLNISHDDQELLNIDTMSGKSINAIRTFPGVGTLVWGARTLDGNNLDWKYINVRRTAIMLEQSIKLALRSYVFEPNDANTWVAVKSMITNFLTGKWKQGALAGSSPEDAYSVDIGLGNTMTAVDILEGKMLVMIKLAITRPAEFIVVTFEQQMQKS